MLYQHTIKMEEFKTELGLELFIKELIVMQYLFYAHKINTVCLRVRRSSEFHVTNIEGLLQHKHNTQWIFPRILFINCFYKKNLNNLCFVEE